MPSEDSKRYLELKGKLENLSGGVKKHSSDEKFPSNITSADIDARVASLLQKRKTFEEYASLAHQKSEEYSIEVDEAEETFSRLSSQIYGFYGKQNLIVEDFGLRTYQKPGVRKRKTDSAVSQ